MGIDIIFQGSNFERLLSGLLVTCKIGFISAALAFVLGIVLGIIMTTKNKVIRFICRIYLEIVRIIPILVWLFIIYFGVATWLNTHLDGIFVSILVFTIWGTAEMGDIVRGALTSIEKHQIESSYSLGLNKIQTYIYILLPQALRRILPGAINLISRMIKTSSLVVLIGVVELVKVGQQIIEVSILSVPTASFWIYGLIFFLYFIICYPLSILAKRLEKLW
ncbi:amino acid ABC transporter permease [Clostridium sp. SHJSY1]|uniref:amino acid ABC transporter permease n=1 Tax=Clostridium sp. SHJSY1 TaxID=2942483 RepID=UPI0028744915|nr:amino acid ABC transporter permease [Clostridium sp. SHJSY1]MDS0527290.1 amino acid ABC transporter permease [Clostridium sp. SHJSY1]